MRTVVLVGENPASQVYVRNKIKACAEAGIRSIHETYAADLGEAELLGRIDALNADSAVHGILVQMPLPAHISPGFTEVTPDPTSRTMPAASWPGCPDSSRARRGAAWR